MVMVDYGAWLNNFETEKVIQTLSGHSDCVRALEFVPTRNNIKDCLLISGSCDKTIRIWDFSSSQKDQCKRVLQDHTDGITTFKLLDNIHFVSGSRDESIKVLDLETGQYVQTLNGHNNSVECFELPSVDCTYVHNL
jgi:angio-associated migratory cell protein